MSRRREWLNIPGVLSSGNAHEPTEDKKRYRDWFVGDFVRFSREHPVPLSSEAAAERFGPRHNARAELKWSAHPAGTSKPGGWTASAEGDLTLGILILGRFINRFRWKGRDEESIVEFISAGDYVIWNGRPDFEHTWEAISDTVFLTVRLPSL